jgi:hypothetical protein
MVLYISFKEGCRLAHGASSPIMFLLHLQHQHRVHVVNLPSACLLYVGIGHCLRCARLSCLLEPPGALEWLGGGCPVWGVAEAGAEAEASRRSFCSK